ncbi:MAG: aldolase/citrate lyase family protein [Neomegalonema sp.]|nr:aldolase/citrate lyase family protein [Neomegalonema sp.]
MELPRNPFKAAIIEGRRQLGLWLTINDAAIAEMLAGCGYDWILIDLEHSSIEPASAPGLLQAMAPYPVHPIVRPASLDPTEIKRLLDRGVQSILVPFVQSVEDAQRAAAAVAYPPDGMRGLAGLTRATRYGAVEDYHRRAREEICLIIQIETRAALDQLEAIAAVPGVDAVFVGPADLAASMGHVGNPSHPDVTAACVDAMARLAAIGKPSGFLTLDEAVTKAIIDAGCVFPAVDVDLAILRKGALNQQEKWRQAMS